MSIQPNKNIILIGMPACGKSTIGVLLAKAIGFQFIDTDLHIQRLTGRLLPELIRDKGMDGFLAVEQKILLNLNVAGHVIATGGSAVYSSQGMVSLKQTGCAYYLKLPVSVIKARLQNILTRGVVIRPGQTIEDLFEERIKLYEHFADQTIACDNKSVEDIVKAIMQC